MRSLFEKRIERAERELRDLKTMHLRGLGTTQFFTKTYQAGQTFNGFIADITFKADEPLPAIAMIYWSNGSSYIPNWDGQLTYEFRSGQAASEWLIISSSEIETFTVREWT